MSQYTLPRHLAVAPLPPLADTMLMLLGSLTMDARRTTGYVPSWTLTEALPDAADLDVVASHNTAGNAAMRALIHAGLVEEVPDLGSRYRLTALGCAVVLLHHQER